MILYLSGSASSAAFLSDSAPYAIVGFILGSLLIRSARRRSEKRRAALEAKKSSLERRAELRRERLRSLLSSYREPMEDLARALGRDPEVVMSRFSEGFLRRGRFDEGMLVGLGEPYVSLIDGPGGVSVQAFALGLLPLFPGAPALSLDLERSDEAPQSILSSLAAWLEGQQMRLFWGGDDGKITLCAALPAELAQQLTRLVPPDDPGALRPFGDARSA